MEGENLILSFIPPIKPFPKSQILSGERRQIFSLPDSIIYDITMNPRNTGVHQKLINSCKYFFNKNPILILYHLEFFQDHYANGGGRWQGCLVGSINNYRPIDMNTVKCKFWVTNLFSVLPYSGFHLNTVSSIIPKIFRVDAERLDLTNQVLTLSDLLLLSSNVEVCSFDDVIITHADGTPVLFEKIVEKFPKLQSISWSFYEKCLCFSSNTVTQLLKIPHFSNVTTLRLDHIPEEFDVKTFFTFVKRQKNMDAVLFYRDSISYRCQSEIEEIVDEMIETESLDYKAPMIYYSGIQSDRLQTIEELYHKYSNIVF